MRGLELRPGLGVGCQEFPCHLQSAALGFFEQGQIMLRFPKVAGLFLVFFQRPPVVPFLSLATCTAFALGSESSAKNWDGSAPAFLEA